MQMELCVPLYMKQVGAPSVEAKWAESFLLLGRQLAKHKPANDVQVVFVVTVPVRDYVAWLIGIGWRLSRFKSMDSDLYVDFPSLAAGTPVTVTTKNGTRCGVFHEWDEKKKRINIEGWWLELANIKSASHHPKYEGPSRYRELPAVGSILEGTCLADNWAAANSQVASDVAIIGIKSRILAESEILVGIQPGSMNKLGDILTVPETTRHTTWCSSIVPSTDGGRADLEANASLVILDGTSAARWLRTIESQFVVCVVDRSQDHESFDESIVRLRAGGVPLGNDFLEWKPPAGIEILGFEVSL